jgi:hypothetical protein
MDELILSDKTQFPTERIILSHLGKSGDVWKALFDSLHANHPDFKEEWRYYNDGKSWLLKVTRKAKTVFWLGVYDGGFRVTLYFSDKGTQALMSSDISAELKKQFKSGHLHGKIRGVTVKMNSKRDVGKVNGLIAVKLAMK